MNKSLTLFILTMMDMRTFIFWIMTIVILLIRHDSYNLKKVVLELSREYFDKIQVKNDGFFILKDSENDKNLQNIF